MERSQMYDIFAAIAVYYPDATWAANANEATVSMWFEPLAPYKYQTVTAAVKACAFTNPYIPRLAELVAYCNKAESPQLGRTAEEAWALVDKALRNSAYNAEREFDRLPKDIQRRVGSAAVLKSWARSDDDGVTVSVARANFLRNYGEDLKERETALRLPESLRQILNGPQQKMIGGQHGKHDRGNGTAE